LYACRPVVEQPDAPANDESLCAVHVVRGAESRRREERGPGVAVFRYAVALRDNAIDDVAGTRDDLSDERR